MPSSTQCSIFLSISCLVFVTGNYKDSLSDANIATDLQPSYVNAIVRGEIHVTYKARFKPSYQTFILDPSSVN